MIKLLMSLPKRHIFFLFIFYLLSLIFYLPATQAQTPTPVPFVFGTDSTTGDFVIRQLGGAVKLRIDSSGNLDVPIKGIAGGGGGNLVPNGSFEYNTAGTGETTGTTNSWTKDFQTTCGASCTYKTEGGSFYGGSKSYSMKPITAGPTGSIGSDVFQVVPNSTLKGSLDINCDINITSGITVSVIYYTGDFTTTVYGSRSGTATTIYSGGCTAGTTWANKSLEFTVPSNCSASGGGAAGTATCTRARVLIARDNTSPTATLYLDNVSVAPPAGSSTLNAANLSSGAFGSNTGGGTYSFPGNVGIGTTWPSTALSVNGIISAATNTNLRLQAGGTGTGSTGTGSIYFLDSSGVVTGRFDSTTGGGNSWPSGDGADGAITVSVNKNINADTLATGRSCVDGGDAVNYSVTTSVAAAATSVTLSTTPSSGCLAVGDEVLIINLQGTTGDNANVGKYETKTISSISTATLTFANGLTNAYDGTTQKIMVQRVPNYTNVTINSGITLTANAWDGTKSGVLFFRASGTVTVNGTIATTGLGYRAMTSSGGPETYQGYMSNPGYTGASGSNYSGVNGGNGGGPSIGGAGGAAGASNGTAGGTGLGGGGGGGTGSNGAGGTGYAGGGGGGKAQCASAGSGGGAAMRYTAQSTAQPTDTSFNKMYLGGGSTSGAKYGSPCIGWGGGDGLGGTPYGGSSGNPGGGTVFISANNVTVNSGGSIQANGGVGGAGGSPSGGGGGGSGGMGGTGGAVKINASIVSLTSNTIQAKGGTGGVGGTGGNGNASAIGGSGGSGATFVNGNDNTGGGGGYGTYADWNSGGQVGGGGGGSGGYSGFGGIIRIQYTTNNGSLTQTPTPTTSTTLDTNTPYGSFYLSTTNTSSADLAEYYVAGDKTIEAGDVVAISNVKLQMTNENGQTEEVTNQGVLRKAEKPYDSKLIGIISTNPGVLMGSIDGDTGKEDKRMLALSGRVPVKIDPDSPPIEVGDFLTSSDKPGLAMKATRPGYVVGRALESWSPSTGSGSANRIDAFISLTYYMGDIDPFGNFRTLEVDSLKANSVKTKTLEVGGVNVMNEINDLKRRLDVIERR